MAPNHNKPRATIWLKLLLLSLVLWCVHAKSHRYGLSSSSTYTNGTTAHVLGGGYSIRVSESVEAKERLKHRNRSWIN